jgi:hypothetical protein
VFGDGVGEDGPEPAEGEAADDGREADGAQEVDGLVGLAVGLGDFEADFVDLQLVA